MHRIRIEVNGDCTSEEYDWSTAAMVRFTAGIDSTTPLTLLGLQSWLHSEAIEIARTRAPARHVVRAGMTGAR